jgi:hypothetical protein
MYHVDYIMLKVQALNVLWRSLYESVLNFYFIYFFQIPMYGFGGHARLIAKGVPRDGAGRLWLMLHQDPHKTVWETCFSLQNFGDLKAFIKIKPISKGDV